LQIGRSHRHLTYFRGGIGSICAADFPDKLTLLSWRCGG